MFSPLRARTPAAVERAALFVCVGLLSASAWLLLSFAGDSAFTHLHHLTHDVEVSPGFLLFFVANWTVMTVAMMLPTSLPILATFHTFASRRADRWLLVALVMLGYLITWALFGVLAYFGNLLWQELLASRALLAQRVSDGAPLLLLVAGAFQFSPLKYRCLDKCRSPFSFVMGHWQGTRERWQAFRLGVNHGVFCVGCCWALMLLMFAVGVGNLVWMLVLAILMAVEKNVAWGKRLSLPVGVGLLLWGAIMLGLP